MTTNARRQDLGGITHRDRFLDIYKALMIIFVVGIHTGYQVVRPDGVSYDINANVGWMWVSWAYGWMITAFFLIGGALTTKALLRERLFEFWWKRAFRLLLPYYAFAAVMVATEFGLKAAGSSTCQGFNVDWALTWISPLHLDCLGLPTMPFWFLVVYIPITLAAPLLYRLWRNKVTRSIYIGGVVVLGLILHHLYFQTQMVDAIKANPAALSPAGGAAFAFLTFGIWSLPFMFGFAYSEGFFHRHRKHLGWAGLGLVATWFLVMTVGNYHWDYPTNQAPPNVAVLLFGMGIFCLMFSIQDTLARICSRKVIRPAIDWLGTNVYTIYIWHVIPFMATWWLLQAIGLRATIDDSLPFVGARVFWFVAPWPLLWVCITIFGRFERIRVPMPRWLRNVSTRWSPGPATPTPNSSETHRRALVHTPTADIRSCEQTHEPEVRDLLGPSGPSSPACTENASTSSGSDRYASS